MYGELVLLCYVVGFGVATLEVMRRIRQHRTAYDDPELERTNYGWRRREWDPGSPNSRYSKSQTERRPEP